MSARGHYLSRGIPQLEVHRPPCFMCNEGERLEGHVVCEHCHDPHYCSKCGGAPRPALGAEHSYTSPSAHARLRRASTVRSGGDE